MDLCTNSLTKREIEVLNFIVLGYSNSKIAKSLYISSFTVQAHVRSILKKLNTNNRIKAAVIAVKLGLAWFYMLIFLQNFLYKKCRKNII